MYERRQTVREPGHKTLTPGGMNRKAVSKTSATHLTSSSQNLPLAGDTAVTTGVLVSANIAAHQPPINDVDDTVHSNRPDLHSNQSVSNHSDGIQSINKLLDDSTHVPVHESMQMGDEVCDIGNPHSGVGSETAVAFNHSTSKRAGLELADSGDAFVAAKRPVLAQ